MATNVKSTVTQRLTQIKDLITGESAPEGIPWNPNCTRFPNRKELPSIEGAPAQAAWVWGKDDFIGRLNLLTPTRVAAAASEIRTGEIVPVNLPLNVPDPPGFNRESFEHEIKMVAPDVCFDDKYSLNTQSGTQWDGFRHFAHVPSKMFYNGVTASDIHGPNADPNKCGIHSWSRHGIAGRGMLIDYWAYCESQGKSFDHFTTHGISYSELEACGKWQGIDIRPAAQGGDIKVGDMVFIRSGWVKSYFARPYEERSKLSLRKHDDGSGGQQYAGVEQSEEMLDWLHDCYFSAVAGDAPSFESWPTKQKYYLHEHVLALWGMPLGEMLDLEGLSAMCRERGRYTFFFTSSPANCPGGVASHVNGQAIF